MSPDPFPSLQIKTEKVVWQHEYCILTLSNFMNIEIPPQSTGIILILICSLVNS